METGSGLVRKRDLHPWLRRKRARLLLRLGVSLAALAAAAGLSAGVVHVVERPVAPFDEMPDARPGAEGPAAAEPDPVEEEASLVLPEAAPRDASR